MAKQTPKAADSQSIRIILYVLGLLGTIGTWGRTAADGTAAHLFQALHGADEYILPGTKTALRKSFTGIRWPIDYQLGILVIFFWEAVDGSHPATSAIGIYFLGQLFPIIVAFYVDGSRARPGFGANLIKPTLWLLSFQLCGIGCIGFAWALAYTASSPTLSRSLSSNALQSASLLSPPATLLILPAVVFGYILPAVCMALPSPAIVTDNFKQLAVVTWNMYPLLVLVILKFLGASAPIFSSRQKDRSTISPHEHLRAVRIVNCATLAISSAIHIGISTLSISTVLFPAIFNAKYAQELSPASLILPPISLTTQGNTVGDGVRSFFLWDQIFGYLIVILVGTLQLRTAAASARGSPPISWTKSLGIVVLTSCLAGPGSAYLALIWLRDEILFENIDGKAAAVGKNKSR